MRHMKKAILSLALAALLSAPALASEGEALAKQNWPQDGIFGTYDKAALQRGFQVYKEVCSACHSMKYLAYRNLQEIGFSPEQVKALAAQVTVTDGPNDDGEMFERPARPSDRFKPAFANDKAARAANNGALPPDMSLLVKAREGGPDYVFGIVTGYADPPAGFQMNPGMNYNKVFPGHQIAMAKPLSDGQVAYTDGTQNTLEQEARDVAQFLSWASEPYQDERKQTGVKVILFLLVFAGVMYAAKKKVWSDVK
jgi:ubiquinol-cytochrome c reductase cytochrome c1 subunit